MRDSMSERRGEFRCRSTIIASASHLSALHFHIPSYLAAICPRRILVPSITPLCRCTPPRIVSLRIRIPRFCSRVCVYPLAAHPTPPSLFVHDFAISVFCRNVNSPTALHTAIKQLNLFEHAGHSTIRINEQERRESNNNRDSVSNIARQE